MKHLSVIKRARQNEKRRVANKSIKSEIKTYYKKTLNALKEKNFSLADDMVKEFVSTVDKAVKKNVIHKNNGNRKKSQIAGMLNKAKVEMQKSEKSDSEVK